MDASLLRWSHVTSTASLVLLTTLLLGVLYKATSRAVKIPKPLDEEVPNLWSRKQAFFTDARRLLEKYHHRFKSQPFGIDAMDGLNIVLPLETMDELKSNPAVEFRATIEREFLTPYTGVGQIYDWGVHEIRARMNPTLGAYVPIFHNLIQGHLEKSFGSPAEWTTFKPHEHIVELVAILSARIMQGEDAARNPAWIKFALSFVNTAVEYGTALKPWPKFLRPVVKNFLPERVEMEKRKAEGREIVAKAMANRRAAGPENPPTMMDHLSTGDHANKADDLELQLWLQMALAAVSIHTTSSTMTQVLYDLAANPEYTKELRAEVEEVLAQSGGVFTKQSLGELKKLDSWIKESFRMGGPDLATFQRLTLEPLTLKDGTYIPVGTKLEVPTAAVNYNPAIYPNPDTFDGLRSYRMRQEEGMAHKHSFVSVSRNELGWGFGKHACPGRFFSDIVIKLTFAELLLNYDIKNLDGQPRPKNTDFGLVVMPDSEHQVLVRARTT
ncbi:hypothetical protein CkaCkLH20_02255 [Colletotrichum karsti]|uniref:Cytochrome P450 n=1 Tax=Colletotrichum karsti TaxID=1095194 RepID=A0A9P6IEA5_9PEZI|nr:uncharacterized protein CkaCkLH20_02255 [Colletotrichum karsti]KAF9880301.1 hypothetical protein CkaCkLH20_02255 [Colletotrichum karsti]